MLSEAVSSVATVLPSLGGTHGAGTELGLSRFYLAPGIVSFRFLVKLVLAVQGPARLYKPEGCGLKEK